MNREKKWRGLREKGRKKWIKDKGGKYKKRFKNQMKKESKKINKESIQKIKKN